VPEAALAETEVLVNVFAGSERSTVEMRVGEADAWIAMEYTITIDPECLRMHEQSPYLDMEHEGKKLDTVFGWKMDYPSKSRHMWKATLPAGLPTGTHTLTVRTTDMFGQVHTSRRIFRVRDAASIPVPGS
ncbi:MAG: calcineurin-like phosphoesterase C-terminal domain-containing protein, partial [Gammaproteobacteria bacterium]|nr:calcineurin-like phosphoesterase C-terminal domain-containing protein [Gammaproteobacteria bacterium]